ncbi:hypothetical protein [Inhella proteolytica]|uniref:CYTH domain-containing protein n=1 Tax=Inhella proteolytica TaxID=2795029 RepID=A0A931J329_9BURK|nr:hypothetical protein [Inhella proteolytica]MBH9578646.1 hypothetical protein [Inhella proteolytica]
MPPKYALVEIERRWLLDTNTLPALDALPCRAISDLYVRGTGLRVRRVDEAGRPTVYKLCKKYNLAPALSRPITNLYLSEAEYALLIELPGQRVHKRRYTLAGGTLDIYADGLAVFEVEFDSEQAALNYQPPEFARREVTHDPAFSGATLASHTKQQP